MRQPYIILKQEQSVSKRYGTPMTKITMVGVRDRKEYITYIDAPNRNHRNWDHIVRNPNHGFVLRNLKIKEHKGKLLIDADSHPIIEWEDVNDVAIMDQLTEIWEEEDLRNTDKFRDLFK